MRLPRMNIQRSMLALVFVAIALWAVPVVLPEAVRRWRVCNAMADELEVEARSRHAEAVRRAARSLPDEARMTREVAEDYEAAAWKYRRALLIPWEFWPLGGDIPLEYFDRTSPKLMGRPGSRGKPRPGASFVPDVREGLVRSRGGASDSRGDADAGRALGS